MSNETKYEDAFGSYWLDNDGNKIREMTDGCGNKYEQDEEGHKTYIGDGYRQDENGNRTYFESGLGGPTYTRNEDGSETTYGESLGHQIRETVSWDKPSELEQSAPEETASEDTQKTSYAERIDSSYEQQLWQQEEEDDTINTESKAYYYPQEPWPRRQQYNPKAETQKVSVSEKIKESLEDKIQNPVNIEKCESLKLKMDNGLSLLNKEFFSEITCILGYQKVDTCIYVRTGKKISGVLRKEYPAEDRFIVALPLHGRNYFLASGNYLGNLESITNDIGLLKKIKGKEGKFHTKKVMSMGVITLLTASSCIALSIQSEILALLYSIPSTALSAFTMHYISKLKNSKIIRDYSLFSEDMNNAVFGNEAKEQLDGEIKEKELKEEGFTW